MTATPVDHTPAMLTRQIKTKLLMYFRFTRGCRAVATEAGPFNADVLAASGREMTEAEVKVSWNDFIRDAKKDKHQYYRMPPEEWRQWFPKPGPLRPNRFFYAVPPELAGRTLEYLAEQYSPYGLIEVRHGTPKALDNGKFCEVRRPAKKLHAAVPDEPDMRGILLRMSSELITLRLLESAVGSGQEEMQWKS